MRRGDSRDRDRDRERGGGRRDREGRRGRSRSRSRERDRKNDRRARHTSSSSSSSSSAGGGRISSSISGYIRSAALAIQKKEEENAKKRADSSADVSTKSRWDSSDEESGEEREIKDNDETKPSMEKKETSEWLQDLEEESDEDGGITYNNHESEKVILKDDLMDIEMQPKDDNKVSTPPSSSPSLSNPPHPAAHLHDPGSSSGVEVKAMAHNPLFHGCRSVDAYQRLNYIDEGTYGLVFRARDRDTGEDVALKQIKFDARFTSKVGFPITALRETNILLALDHPNIVRVKEMVVGSSVDKIYMVMEYLENDLKACMDMSKTPFSISEVKRLMLQLLGAINHMHERWYIHRDLKTSNLLYSNAERKLAVCDFGMARKYGSPLKPYTFEVITLWYRCPELLLGKRKYSTAVDMWSIGCIFAELLLQKPLFMGEGEVDQISKIFKLIGAPTKELWPGYDSLPLSNKISKNIPGRSKLRKLFPKTSFGGGMSLSESGFDLLSHLLDMNPDTRISAADALSHTWFAEQPYPCPSELMPTFEKTDI